MMQQAANTNAPEDEEARAIMRDALHGARTRLLACFPRNRLSPVARGELEALEGHLQALSERVERGSIG